MICWRCIAIGLDYEVPTSTVEQRSQGKYVGMNDSQPWKNVNFEKFLEISLAWDVPKWLVCDAAVFGRGRKVAWHAVAPVAVAE